MSIVGGNIADEKGFVGWLMRRSLKGFQEV